MVCRKAISQCYVCYGNCGYPILSRNRSHLLNTRVLSIASAFRSRKKGQVQHLPPSISEQGRKEEENKKKIKEKRTKKLQQKLLVVSLVILAIGFAVTVQLVRFS